MCIRDRYKGECVEGKAFQVMIDNNLDHEVALYPYELVTYLSLIHIWNVLLKKF